MPYYSSTGYGKGFCYYMTLYAFCPTREATEQTQVTQGCSRIVRIVSVIRCRILVSWGFGDVGYVFLVFWDVGYGCKESGLHPEVTAASVKAQNERIASQADLIGECPESAQVTDSRRVRVAMAGVRHRFKVLHKIFFQNPSRFGSYRSMMPLWRNSCAVAFRDLFAIRSDHSFCTLPRIFLNNSAPIFVVPAFRSGHASDATPCMRWGTWRP